MALKWKLVILFGAAAVIVLVMVYSPLKFGNQLLSDNQTSEQTGVSPVGGANSTLTPVAPSPATGNIDDAAAAILRDSADDAAAFQTENGELNFIAADSQAISDFGQVYDEKEF